MTWNNRACRPFSRIYDLNAAMGKLLNSPTSRKDFTMKKAVLVFLLVLTFTVVHAQTIVIERPGILTDLSTAIIGVPAAAVTGIVSGIVEAGRNLVCGSTTIVINPAPVVIPQRQVIVTSPIVTGWSSTSVTTTALGPVPVAPGVAVQPAPTMTIRTNYGNGTSVTVTRPAGGFELGSGTVYPVPPERRVGTNPFVNPYINRQR